MTIDQVTYDVITPMAARSIFEAVHWTPSIFWLIESIEVLHPIRLRWNDRGDGGRALELIDVRYAIRARFEFTPSIGPRDNPGQHSKMFRTRAKRQQFYRTPYLGRRDLVADIRLLEEGESLSSYHSGTGETDLGWMLFDRDFSGDHKPLFYRSRMIDGRIDIAGVDRQALSA